MRYYTGLDVSQKETSICIMDETGKIIKEGKVPTCPIQISLFLRKTNLTFKYIGLETGHHSHWIAKELKDQNFPVVCLCARRLANFLSAKYNKTDRIDARGTTEALRVGAFHEVYLKTHDQLELRMLLSARESLGNQKKQISNKIRGFLKPFGIKKLGDSDSNEFEQNVRDSISSFGIHVKTSIEALLASFVHQKNQLLNLDKEIEQIAENNPQARRLMTAPGVGPVTALYFLVEIGDPHRFKNARAVGAYLGMTPRLYESGEISRQGGISKCGCKYLRSLMRNVGMNIMNRCKRWFNHKTWGFSKLKKIGKQKVYVAIGRRMAGTLWSMLIHEKNFDYRDKKKKKDKLIKERNKVKCIA